jgi:CHAT domain-containing protein
MRACSSGHQGERNRGDELEGLTRALLYAGASAVVVSLWNVDQESSGDIFRRLYRKWSPHDDTIPLWRAWSEAERQGLSSSKPALRHPYHWAPFTVIGDPR